MRGIGDTRIKDRYVDVSECCGYIAQGASAADAGAVEHHHRLVTGSTEVNGRGRITAHTAALINQLRTLGAIGMCCYDDSDGHSSPGLIGGEQAGRHGCERDIARSDNGTLI